MYTSLPGRALSIGIAVTACASNFVTGCTSGDEGLLLVETPQLASSKKLPRYAVIRDAARTRGLVNTGYLLAGIANDETGLAMCWSEATWACQGPSSPDCGNGPVIAGSADGPCSVHQGGLGMFQFDAGTYTDTIDRYGTDVLTVAGQTSHAIDYAAHMVQISAYTTNAETPEKALAWMASFDPNNSTLRDQWIKTVVRYYNGCQPSWSCWSSRYQTYSDGLSLAIDEPGGLAFWRGTGCDVDLTAGVIHDKYLALGGCMSVLGTPTTEERPCADGAGRYNDFQHGSIYWTHALGAHEVHGVIRDKWATLGWETSVVGYPVSDETAAPDGVGRYSVFVSGSIYWTPTLGAHEVHGRVRDAYKDAGWEAGDLGYPTSDEYAVAGGRRNDFEGGYIVWDSATDTTAVTLQ